MNSPDIETLRRAWISDEIKLFEREYRDHFIPGETHPPSIGEPYLLHHPDSCKGVLLIHGFMAAPYEVRQWAEHLYGQGFTVYSPRLAGHGTSALDLEYRTRHDWSHSVDRGYQILASLCDTLYVAGFSTGAGLALHQAICHPSRYQAVISVSAPLRFKGFSSRLSRAVEMWNMACETVGLKIFQKTFAVNHPDNPHINYNRCPIKGYNQVKALMKTVYQELSSISIPSLIIQGSRDPKVDPRSGRMIFDRIGSASKVYREIMHDRHGIVRGPASRAVFSEVMEFLSHLAANPES